MKMLHAMRIILWIALLGMISACQADLAALPTQAAAASPSPIIVMPSQTAVLRDDLLPEGPNPRIDGTIDPGEWDQAMTKEFSDGSELFLMHNDGFLYLAIQASTPEMIAANVFLEEEGEIRIMHASAALGTGFYQKQAGNWTLIQNFEWRCRDSDDSPQALAAREEFLLQEHWLAGNSRMGTPNQLEYQIQMTDETLRIAISFMRSSAADERIFWPADLTDACTQAFPGGLPLELEFLPEDWGLLRLSPSE